MRIGERMRRVVLVAVALTASIAAAFAVTDRFAGAQKSDGEPRQVAVAPSNAEVVDRTRGIGRDCPTDGSADFDHYYLGDAFEGMPARGSRRECQPPPPVLADDRGEAVHARPVRINDMVYVYGDCVAPEGSDGGCAPPLQVSSAPACERPHSLYHRYTGPPELDLGVYPHRHSRFRGVPAAVFEDGTRLELYTNDATVSITGPDQGTVRRAAAAMVAPPSSRSGQRSKGDDLPPPRRGASEDDAPPPDC